MVASTTSDAGSLEGCLSFVVARDAANLNVTWLTQAWESKERWPALVDQPGVKASLDVVIETQVARVLPG